MSPRRYFTVTLGTTLTLVVVAWLLAWWLQPLYGDLTRIGSHAEQDYGWNEPMLEFHPLLSTFGAWEQPVDVLVIGDSFANLRPHQQWQNWLALRTGWRIHTLDMHLVDIAVLTASPLYRKHPPRVVIWNNIERGLKDENNLRSGQCETSPGFGVDPLKVRVATALPPPRITQRSRALSELNPGFSRLWLLRSIARGVGLETSDALAARLVRSDLFSNRLASNVLVYRKDLLKSSWKAEDLPRIRCGFSRLAKHFEANGVTRFVTALAPDKSSAYRPWLVNPDSLPRSHLPALLNNFPVPDARLDIALSKAIATGTRDVYMPDDTHWGSAGHRLAADAIQHLLLESGLAK